MPKVSIDHDCNVSAPEAFRRIRRFFETDVDLRRLDPGLRCTFDEGDLTGQLTGTQVSASIAVTPQGAGSRVSVSVDLPLLLAPFRGKVQETLQQALTKQLT